MLKEGKCYHIKFLPKKDGSYEEAVIQVTKIRIAHNTCEYDIVPIACTMPWSSFSSFITYDTIKCLQNRILEVTDIKDLPLYLGWAYTSPELALIIKHGAWNEKELIWK